MVEGYRVLKNRLIHDDVICPQDADAAHLAFWERIQQLTEELDNYKEKALCIHTYWNDETRIEAVMHELKLKGMTIKENNNGK